MLTRLLPNQIPDAWSVIRNDALDLLPDGMQSATDVVSAMMRDTVNLWMFHPDGSAGNVSGFAITSVVKDELTERRNLVVHAIMSYSFTDDELWIEVFEGLRKFAKARGCTYVIGFTKSRHFLMLAEHFGCEVDYMISISTNGVYNGKE